MTGFKEGAASSGLGSDDEEEESEEQDLDEPPELEQESQDKRIESGSETEGAPSQGKLPWIYRRSSITDGRAKTVQLHLQQSTLDDEHGELTEIEDRIEESVNKADLREAAYLVGLQHVDEVTDQLREWGYDAS